jgi:hypothetical protein
MTDGSLLIAMIVFALLVALLVLLGVGTAVIAARRPQGREEQALAGLEGKAPEGEWMGRGIAIGLAFGMLLGLLMGVVMDDMPLGITLGPGMGVAIGVAIGSALEQRHKDDIRPLTPEERRARTRLLGATLGLLVLGVVLAALLLVIGF